MNPGRLAGRTLVIVSTQDWDDLQTRKQRFARRFAREGCRVLYVETQWHWLTYARRRERARVRIRQAGKPPRPLETNLWLWTPPPQLPFFQIWEPLARFNNTLLAPKLRAALDAIGGESTPLLWLYTPYNSLLIDALDPQVSLYECVDDYAAARGLIRAETVERLERRTLKRVDACVVTAQALFDQRKEKIDNLHLIPNGVDVEHFLKAGEIEPAPEIAAIPRPRLGFLGAVNYWIDLDLLAKIARARPAWHLVVVGPADMNVSALRREPNVHLLGRQPFDRLPELVAGFDVCLVPYLLDDVARGCSPLKLFEYLASGKPIVSVPMPEALRFAPPVYIGTGEEGFVQAIETALSESSLEACARKRVQQNLARSNSWDDRFERTVSVWESLLR